MRIENKALVLLFSGPGVCEFCKRPVRQRDAHHIHTKGAGRLDIAVNLIALCSTFSGGENCHARFHDGHILRIDLFAIACAREGVLQGDALTVIHLLRRLPRDCRPWQLEAAMDSCVREDGLVGMNLAQRELLQKILEER